MHWFFASVINKKPIYADGRTNAFNYIHINAVAALANSTKKLFVEFFQRLYFLNFLPNLQTFFMLALMSKICEIPGTIMRKRLTESKALSCKNCTEINRKSMKN